MILSRGQQDPIPRWEQPGNKVRGGTQGEVEDNIILHRETLGKTSLEETRTSAPGGILQQNTFLKSVRPGTLVRGVGLIC